MAQSQLLHIDNFHLLELNRRRTIRIYLPPDYNETNRHYPVIYMHDGQNLFEKETSSFGSIWDVRHLLDDLYHHDERHAYIVVGIDNGGLYRFRVRKHLSQAFVRMFGGGSSINPFQS